MLKQFWSHLSPKIGIDLGTSQIRLWASTTNETIQEASCLAVDQRSQKVVAVGDEAAAMEGRVSSQIQVLYPIRNGEIVDKDLFQALLKVLLQRVLSATSLWRPVVMVSVPQRLSKAKKQVLVEAVYELGVDQVFTISQPLAAAIGTGIPIADASGSLLIQCGAGIVEAAIVSLGSVVASRAHDFAGLAIDERIQNLVLKSADLVISRQTAELLKKKVGTLYSDREFEILVSGQDAAQVSPKELMIDSNLLKPVFEVVGTRFEELLQQVLSQVPPELAVDVIDKGVLLSGGLGQLSGLDAFLVQRVGVPVTTVEKPTQTAIQGIITALEHLSEFQESINFQAE